MTITEFLLARIADDQERAEFVARQVEGNNWSSFEAWRLSWHDEYDLLCIEPSRALAECEAKRRIVEAQAENDDRRYEPGFHFRAQMIDHFLRVLAAVYADHPDYDPGWATMASLRGIPTTIRRVLLEALEPEAALLWWDSANTMLDGRRPRDDHDAALRIAHMIADGNFA